MSRPEPKTETKPKTKPVLRQLIATNFACGGCDHLKKQLFGLKKILKENEKLLNDLLTTVEQQSSSSGAPHNTDFLKKKFAELYCKVKEDTDCIFCTDQLTVDTIEVPDCGHVICKSCCSNLLEAETKSQKKATCPSCRKPLRQMVNDKK